MLEAGDDYAQPLMERASLPGQPAGTGRGVEMD